MGGYPSLDVIWDEGVCRVMVVLGVDREKGETRPHEF